MAHRKANLPEKTCAYCQRPFAWRKKWARDWDQVKYCSDQCRHSAKRGRLTNESTRDDSRSPSE